MNPTVLVRGSHDRGNSNVLRSSLFEEAGVANAGIIGDAYELPIRSKATREFLIIRFPWGRGHG